MSLTLPALTCKSDRRISYKNFVKNRSFVIKNFVLEINLCILMKFYIFFSDIAIA